MNQLQQNPDLAGFILCLALEAVLLFVAWALCVMSGHDREKMDKAVQDEWKKYEQRKKAMIRRKAGECE